MRKELTLFALGCLVSLFNIHAQNWDEVIKSQSNQPNKISGDYGTSISIDGDFAVISAPGYNYNQGTVYVLQRIGAAWETVAQLKASDGTANDNFGSSVGFNGDNIVVGAYNDYDSGENTGSAYVFTKPSEGWSDMTETAKLTATDGSAEDKFGQCVSISGDNIVIGAHWDNHHGNDSGSAYVFTKPQEGWIDMTETAKLTASDADTEDKFGISVSICGDNIVIGANWNNDAGINSGSAYVFTKPMEGWSTMTETAKLTSSDAEAYDLFGASVSISGDNIIIGARYEDGSGSDRGAAYLFTKPSLGWSRMTETAKLTASDAANVDMFGKSVSISDETIVIGAHYEDISGNASGSAYVFTISSDGTITQTAKLNAEDGAEEDYFGRFVCISGDYILVQAEGNSDDFINNSSVYAFEKSGANWMSTSSSEEYTVLFEPNEDNLYGHSVSIDGDYAVVGAYGYQNCQGIVYVLKHNGTVWEMVAQLTASDGAINDQFGISVSISGDNIVVGANYGDDSFEDSGSAYVFTKPQGGWSDMIETAKLTASDGAFEDKFGSSVSISDDNIVIGAHWDNDRGSAYVFTKPTEGWSTMTETAKLTAYDAAIDDMFGISVSISGDNIVVGANWNNDDGTNSGSAYVFTKPTEGWSTMTETAKLTASDAGAYDLFGSVVSISGDNIVIGASYENGSGDDRGAAYVFTKPNLGWNSSTETTKLKASDAEDSDRFGISVSISGNTIVIGAHIDDTSVADSGSAYVYTISSDGTITETDKLIASDGEVDDYFGKYVCINGDNIIVGAYGDDDLGNESGSAYIFTKMYNVRFLDYDGELIEELIVNSGEAATAPADPIRNGFTFTGWDTAFDNVTSNLVVTALYDNATGIFTDESNKYNIYPNPATIQFTVEGGNGEAVSIYNTAGAQVLQLQNISDKQTINIDELPKGFYVVKIGNQTQRLLIK